ncbi:MAG: hypothetical protein HZA93_15790 [Verrucomicrobia bacterium]|nr:hypothetical protein [Verrucomicrobiota bacterium]
MKRLTSPLLLALAFALVLAPLAFAAAAPAASAPKDKSPAAPLAAAVSTVTGIAISPLLGTGAFGAYQWMQAKTEAEKAALPWYAQWSFFGPALLLVGACAAKDALGSVVPPGLKKPLDVLETIENKATGLVAAGAVVPLTMSAVSKMVLGGGTAAVEHGAQTGGLAMLPLGAADLSWLLNLATVPFGVAMFALVWMASHAINVLILLSPWGAIDAALKAARTGLLGLLTLSATINPWLGAVLSLVVIVVAYLVAGWAFRLTVFGSVFCWEFLSGRKNRFSPTENDNRLFSSSGLAGVPVRTYGRLVLRTSGDLEFYYRPWLVLPERSAKVGLTGRELAVGRGLFFSTIDAASGGAWFVLPPRYRGHEDTLARAYQLGGVREAGLRKAWSALKELLGVKSAPAGASA